MNVAEDIQTGSNNPNHHDFIKFLGILFGIDGGAVVQLVEADINPNNVG